MQNRGDKVSKQNEWKEWLQKQTTLQPKTTLQETITSIDKINEILLNSSPDFIFRVSREGVYLDYKAEDEKELYYSPSNFLGKSMTDLFPPSIAIKATQCITTTVTTGENTAYSYELNYNGLWKTFIASFSKFNAEECLILVQEAKAPSSNRKRAAGPFSYTTYTIEPKEKRLKKRDKYNLPMKSNSAESLLGSLSPSKVLKMLVITSQPLWNADGNEPVTLLDGQNERHSISQGIRISTLSVKISFLREATLGNVMNALKGGWDFIHISAHGTKDTIWLEDGLGCTYNLSVDEFASCFTTNTTTKLVVISACHTLEIGRLVYDTLSKNGVRQVNVIAIQGSMSDSASAVFAQCFYQALGNSSINDAFASAQKSLSKSPIVTDSDLETEESLLPWSDRFMLFGDKSMSFASNSAYKGGIVEETHLPEINVVSNLPKLSSNFIGREKDLVEVVRLFEKEKIPRVCVFGPGGIGKTEFAKLVASWMKERGHVQTVLWSSSEPAEIDTQVNDILSLIEQAKSLFNLNFSETLLEKQKSYIYQYLRNNNTLIVIDSWENIKVKDRWPIWTFLNSLPYNTRVLITSRDILPAIEVHNYELDRLDNRKARILFWNTLRNAGYFKDRKALTVEEVEVLTDIVRTLEGYPLAIIIAAGQSRSKTLKQIKQEFLNKPKMVLEAVNEITAQPQGIWTSLNVSYDTLTLTEQRVFRQMCIFPEAILDVAIQAVTSIEENELHNILDVLVRRSLIRRAKNLFALHKIIQEYGKSKLIEEGEDLTVLHQRVITYYQNKFSEDGNMENLLSTHYHLVILFETFKNLQAGQLILERFQLLFLHLVFIGDYAKAIQITEEVLSVANKLNNKKLTIQAYRSLGDITLHSKMKVETATKYISESLKMALELSDNHEIVKCLNSQGYLVYLLEDLNGAKKILHESLNLSRSLADVNEEDIAETLTLLGAVYTEEDNYAEAKFLLEQSLDLLQTTISNLEKLQKDSSKMNSTIYYRIKASKWKQAAAISFFARLEYKKGDLEVTKKLYLSQLKISKEMDNAIGIAECLYQLGTIEQLLKDYNEATNLYSMALKVAHGVQAFDKVIMITYNMAELAKIMNDPEKARLLYAESLQNALLNYDARMAIRVQLSWARLEVETNNLDKSATLLRRALNVAMQLKDNVLMEKIQRYIVLVDTKDPSLRLDWSQDDSSAFD